MDHPVVGHLCVPEIQRFQPLAGTQVPNTRVTNRQSSQAQRLQRPPTGNDRDPVSIVEAAVLKSPSSRLLQHFQCLGQLRIAEFVRSLLVRAGVHASDDVPRIASVAHWSVRSPDSRWGVRPKRSVSLQSRPSGACFARLVAHRMRSSASAHHLPTSRARCSGRCHDQRCVRRRLVRNRGPVGRRRESLLRKRSLHW